MASKIEAPLVDATEAVIADALAQAAGLHVAGLPVDRIDGDRNLRADLGDLSELAASIRNVGVLQPIAVTPAGDDRYQVVYGHRRLAAAREAGLTVIPAIVRAPLEEPERVVTMIVENIHRRDFTPLEEARAFQTLRDLGLSQRDMVTRVGRSQAHVSKRLSLLKLTDHALSALDSGGITLEDALALTKLADHPVQLDEALATASDPKAYTTVSAQVYRRLRRIEIEQARDAAFAALADQGVHVVDDGGWWNRKEQVIGQGYHQLDVDPEVHAGEPCHAATVDPTGEIQLVCTTPERHLEVPEPQDEPAERLALTSVPSPATDGNPTGDPRSPASETDATDQPARDPEVGASALKVAPPSPPPPLSPEEEQAQAHREAERAERDRQRAETDQARTRRTETMRRLLHGKVSRTKALDFVLRQLISAALSNHGEQAVCALLDLEPATPGGWAPEEEPYAVERFADASADRLLRAALAVALVHGEPNPYTAMAEAVAFDDVQRHYRFLQDNGYEPTDAEAQALAEAAKPAAAHDGEPDDAESGR